MIDRSIAPPINSITGVNLLDYELVRLKNGVPVYIFNAGSQDVVSLEIIFDAGSWRQDKVLVASCTNALLKEGTKKYSSQEISEAIDYYGSFLQTDVNKDNASVALYSTHKQLGNVLPYLTEVLTSPVFDESELATHLARMEQRFIVNREKNSSIAREEFLNKLFGSSHPYGRKAEKQAFQQVNSQDLLAFWKQHYVKEDCMVFLSGKITEEVFQQIDDALVVPEGQKEVSKEHEIQSSSALKHFIEKPDSVQSAIRIGKLTIGKSHDDFVKLQLVCTVLGGYFGSRLMSNIREDKGYTYGIGSFIAPMKQASYFGIATEVGVDITGQAIDEIYKEINRLGTELIPNDELKLVKSYLMGEILKSVDGPFALAERWKGMLLFGLDRTYFNKMIETISSITPEEVLDIAKKYLVAEEMYEVVVGRK